MSEPNQSKKGLLKKYFGQTSLYEEVCEKLSMNRHWPFDDYGPFFELEFVNPEFYSSVVSLFFSAALITICTVCTISDGFRIPFFGLTHSDLSFVPFILLPLYSFHKIVNIITYWKERQLSIRKLDNWYEFKIGDNVVHEGDLSDLYIRLEALQCTNNCSYYRLVLNGYKVEKYKLTSLSKRKDALDRIGRMIARRINLNYFDSSDISNKNVIRHVEAGQLRVEPKQPKQSNFMKRASMMADGFF